MNGSNVRMILIRMIDCMMHIHFSVDPKGFSGSGGTGGTGGSGGSGSYT